MSPTDQTQHEATHRPERKIQATSKRQRGFLPKAAHDLSVADAPIPGKTPGAADKQHHPYSSRVQNAARPRAANDVSPAGASPNWRKSSRTRVDCPTSDTDPRDIFLQGP